MDFTKLLAQRTRRMEASAIREILKVVSRPGMLSLAGGIPAPESFPLEIMKELTSRVIEKYSSSAFQYGLSEGFSPLREALTGYLRAKGIPASEDEIFIGSGSQGVLDALGKILVSRGDSIAVEAPTYLGAIQAFNAYEPVYARLDTDDDGIVPESLERVLESGRIKFIYLVPTFQNPTGRTIPLVRRERIAGIIQKHNALLIEDDPYSALRYRGENIPPIKTLAPENVVYVSTLSKVFAPGLRVGFFVAPQLIREWLVLAKQGVDLHTSTFNQALAAEYLLGGYLDAHLPKIIDIYRPKQEALFHALGKHFPDSFKWSKPEGGMFIWAEGPEGIDMEKIYWKSIEKSVAFVPGKFFFTRKGEGIETMRLNYTMADEEGIHSAVKTLSEVIKREL
jgi:2-aminoadipate transaminase